MTTTTNPQRGANGARKTLALAVFAALYAAQAAIAAPSPAAVATSTPLGRGDAVLGAVPAQQPLHVVVALKLRNKDALDAFVAGSMASQAKGATVKPMTSAQVLANHMPTLQQAQAVADYLSGMGFRNVKISANRLLVKADGTAAIAGSAFQNSFRQVRTQDGRIAFANIDDAHVPAALADTVQSVFGLQELYQAHAIATAPKPLHFTTRTRATDSASPMSVTNSYFPDEFPTIYDTDSNAPVRSITAGVVTEGDLTQTLADLDHYTDDADRPRVATHVVAVDSTSSDTTGTVQWNLASQDIVGAAGGFLHQLDFYNMPDTTNGSLVDAFNQAVVDNDARVIDVPFAECETDAKGAGGADAADAIFEVAVAQGQTFAVSTGDTGADECPADGTTTKIPSWPANSQYVVAVAGTHLVAGSPSTIPKAWSSETVWSETGGSPSLYEPRPGWQSLGTSRHRNVADVAFDADPNTGASIYIGNASGGAGYYTVGGTGLSAAIFSGLWSRVLQHKRVGFAGPILYALQDADFHDITSGSNGIPAAVGYDPASGRGSLMLGNVVADIDAHNLGNHRPVAAFTFTSFGLTGTFTNTSTDPDGNDTLGACNWDFGDGGGDNQSCRHGSQVTHAFVFKRAGTYTVNLIERDTLSAASSVSHTVTVAPLQVIVNPHFDWAVHGPWVMTPGVLQSNASLAHSGSGYVLLGGGSGALANSIKQTVVVPTGVTTSRLEYWVKTTTAETGTVAHDRLEVQVYIGGTLVATPDTVSNLDATPGYVLRRVDMTPWIGKAITVKFFASNNRSLTTRWSVDDVTLHGF